jgi:hypothetical protein
VVVGAWAWRRPSIRSSTNRGGHAAGRCGAHGIAMAGIPVRSGEGDAFGLLADIGDPTWTDSLCWRARTSSIRHYLAAPYANPQPRPPALSAWSGHRDRRSWSWPFRGARGSALGRGSGGLPSVRAFLSAGVALDARASSRQGSALAGLEQAVRSAACRLRTGRRGRRTMCSVRTEGQHLAAVLVVRRPPQSQYQRAR